MKRHILGIIVLAGILLAFTSLSEATKGGKKKRAKYVGIEEESTMKEYNPNAVWQRVPCERCGGTGSQEKQSYDAKKNSMVKWLEPCPSCKGRGYLGMSRK